MVSKPNALEFFRGPQRYNCAQAVLKTYASVAGVGQACVDQFARYGGGRAPGGECGALYAAKALLADPQAKQEVEQHFLTVTGTTACRDIRQERRVSCEQCVQAAADAVFTQLEMNSPLQPPSECPGG